MSSSTINLKQFRPFLSESPSANSGTIYCNSRVNVILTLTLITMVSLLTHLQATPGNHLLDPFHCTAREFCRAGPIVYQLEFQREFPRVCQMVYQLEFQREFLWEFHRELWLTLQWTTYSARQRECRWELLSLPHTTSSFKVSLPRKLLPTSFPHLTTKTHQPTFPLHDALPTTRPRRHNVGTWKDGPAKIRACPMDNESYELHILLDNACDSPAAFITNQGHIPVQPQPQRISKCTLLECTLLQDPWVNPTDLYGCVSMDSWDPTQMNDCDPHLLAVKSSKSKYNEDNPSYDNAIRGPFQAEYWKAMQVELTTLVDVFKC
jgi:hypothetical protein